MFYLNLNSKLRSLVLGTEILMKTPAKIENLASLSMIYDRNALLVLSVVIFSENKFSGKGFWSQIHLVPFSSHKNEFFVFLFYFSSWLRPKVLNSENLFNPDQAWSQTIFCHLPKVVTCLLLP